MSLWGYPSTSFSSPQIGEPRLIQLSTEHGLSQDTINDMLIDREGFLWLATDGGLNRYDGHHNVQFHGHNKEFADDALYSLFEDDRGDLWVSTLSNGILRLDRQSGTTEKMLHLTYASQPTWSQSATWYQQLDQERLLIGLDHVLIEYSLVTKSHRVLFDMTVWTEEEDEIIRFVLPHDGLFFVATSLGLVVVEQATGEVTSLDYLGELTPNHNNVNAKLLHVDERNNLWIGTVEGLFSMPVEAIQRFLNDNAPMPAATLVVEGLNFWSFLQDEGDRYYVGTDQGLYTFDFASQALTHILRPTDSRLLLSDNDIVKLVRTSSGKIWMATRTDGALLWSPEQVHFKNLFKKGDETYISGQLSDNDVYTLFQRPDKDELWIGTNNGLNVFSPRTGHIASYLITDDNKATFSSGSVYTIVPAQDNTVWLVTGAGIVKFDLDNRQLITPTLSEQAALIMHSDEAYAMTALGNGQYLIMSNAKFWVFDEATGEVAEHPTLSKGLNPSQFNDFMPGLTDDDVLIAQTAELWQYQRSSDTLVKLHGLAKHQGEYNVAPTRPLQDEHGILWIAYPGVGLFGVDAQRYEQRAFYSVKDILPSNMVFGLQKDAEGAIWMASHKGLLQFFPETAYIRQFSVRDGLASNEFNWGANLRLDNGHFVYGSQKGFTIFNPLDVKGPRKQASNAVAITSVTVLSRPLWGGVGTLNNGHVTLAHDDVGVKISFSDMAYSHREATFYKYTLSGATDIDYPRSHSTEVEFPQLAPGRYVFAVSAFDNDSGTIGPAALLHINVKYAPYSSPLAYASYALVVLLLLSLFIRQRRQQNKRLRMALDDAIRTESRLSMALTASNSNVWEWRSDTDSMREARIEEELGYRKDAIEPTLSSHLALIHEQDRDVFLARWRAVIDKHQHSFDVTYRMRTATGEYQWYRDLGSLVELSAEDDSIVMAGTYTNMTSSLDTQEKARLFGEAFQYTRDWVVIFNGKLQPIATNQAFNDAFAVIESQELAPQLKRLFAFDAASLPEYGRKMIELKAGEHWEGEGTLRALDGNEYHLDIKLSAIAAFNDPSRIDRYLMILSDVSEQKAAEAALWQLANYDSLTELPNRSLLLDRIKHASEQALSEDVKLGLFFIDLDRFKQVNDSLGHEAGDTLLKIIAARIAGLLRPSDTLARLGGDEFVVMIEYVEDSSVLGALATEIIFAVEQPVTLKNQVVSVSASIGIALFPDDAKTATDLLKNADIAMYHAKEKGQSQFQYFTESMNQLVQQKLKLENMLKQAYLNKQFENYYQPIVDCHTGSLKGAELLMRWPSDEGMISPDVFVPIAEDLGLIEQLTWDAVARAIPIVASLLALVPDGYVAINLSAKHFATLQNLRQLVDALTDSGLATSCIRFEITESALMSDSTKAQAIMQEMKSYGFKIALDDFGTGYSSLKYLKDFPIDVIKIDKSFVQDIGVNKGNEAIIIAILRMAESLHMRCVAEGIETEAQIAFLQQHNCHYLQGYYFAKPQSSEQLLANMASLIHTPVDID